MRPMRMTVLSLALIICGLPLIAHAQAGAIYLSTSPNGSTCGIQDTQGLVTVYVIARPYSGGITAAQFSAPLPPCVVGATWLCDIAVFPVTLGNSQQGVSIGFGSCKTSSDFPVLTIMYFMQGLTEVCCPYPILPDPYAETGQVQFVDCDFNLATGHGYSSYVSKTASLPPLVGDPGPNDGATERPLDTKLSWSVHRCDCFMCGHFNQVFFGTSPEPPSVANGVEEDTYDPGPLQPSATYYWKIKTYVGSSLSTTTPVWSFSTVVGVPAQYTTWGKVKALYGE